MKTIRYLIQETPIGMRLMLSNKGKWIEASDFDRVNAERDALQLRLNAVEEENDRLRTNTNHGEPVAWLTKCKHSGLVEQAEPNEKASNPEHWTDAFPVYNSSVEYEIAGYEGSSGLYYSRHAAVANGEQSIEPVYRVKK